LSEAERILAESTDLSELRKLHDVAQAAQAFARAHALGVEAEKHAFMIRTNAGIRLAELCPPKPPKESGKAGADAQGPGRGRGKGREPVTGHSRRETPVTPPLPAPRLSEYRRLAELPKQEVARRLDDAAQSDHLSMRELLKRRRDAPTARHGRPTERRATPPTPTQRVVDPFAALERLRVQREAIRAYEFARLALRDDNEGHLILALVLDGGELAMARLGLNWESTPEDLKRAQKSAALSAHPDRGGSAEAMARINLDCDLLRPWFTGGGQ